MPFTEICIYQVKPQKAEEFEALMMEAKHFLEKQEGLSFTLIRKYSQQLIINADKQGASKSREYITFISGRFSAFLLRNRTPFLRADI